MVRWFGKKVREGCQKDFLHRQRRRSFSYTHYTPSLSYHIFKQIDHIQSVIMAIYNNGKNGMLPQYYYDYDDITANNKGREYRMRVVYNIDREK